MKIKSFKNSWFILVMLSLIFVACDDDDMDCCPMPPESDNDVWIANEGVFPRGNASLDLYNSDSNRVETSVFNSVNGRSIGDVLQSITFHESNAYLFVNNSSRIEVINTDDYSSIATITDRVYSPRYGVVLDDYIYFSDISRNFLYVIDTESHKVVDSINTRVPVEELVVFDDKIFATANNYLTPYNQLYVIDPDQKLVIDSVEVGLNPNALIMDDEDHIWVMCDGEFGMPGTEGLYRVDAKDLEVLQEFTFPFTPAYPTRLAVNSADADEIFISGPDGVYRVELEATDFPTSPFLEYTGSLYALNIHPENGDIYIGDAADGDSFGSVHIYDSNGDTQHSFIVGYWPSRFYFR